MFESCGTYWDLHSFQEREKKRERGREGERERERDVTRDDKNVVYV